MRRILAAVAILLASCGGTSATTSTTTSTTQPPPVPEDLLTEEVVQELGFAIARPIDWTPEIEADVGIASFYSPPIPGDAFTENFNIAATDVPDELTFEVYVQNDARSLNQSAGVEIVDSGQTDLDGEPAATVRFRTTVDGVDIGVVRAITLHAGQAYEFSFFASEEEMDRWLPIVEQILNTFRFLD